jgi:hypothetical protein
MFCDRCGTQLASGVQFCANCGESACPGSGSASRCQREMAIRTALGGTRLRLIRQLLTD